MVMAWVNVTPSEFCNDSLNETLCNVRKQTARTTCAFAGSASVGIRLITAKAKVWKFSMSAPGPQKSRFRE